MLHPHIFATQCLVWWFLAFVALRQPHHLPAWLATSHLVCVVCQDNRAHWPACISFGQYCISLCVVVPAPCLVSVTTRGNGVLILQHLCNYISCCTPAGSQHSPLCISLTTGHRCGLVCVYVPNGSLMRHSIMCDESTLHLPWCISLVASRCAAFFNYPCRARNLLFDAQVAVTCLEPRYIVVACVLLMWPVSSGGCAACRPGVLQ